MGLFARLFQGVLNKVFGAARPGSKPGPASAPYTTSPAAKKIADQIQQEANEFNKRVGSREGREGLLADLEKKLRAKTEAEETRKRKEAEKAVDPSYAFVHLGVALLLGRDFKSSNPDQAKACVRWVQYDLASESLYVEYVKNGTLYRYWPVNEKEAASVYHSISKGIWVWDNLRIRKTKLGHRKNYALLGGGAPATTSGGYQTGSALPQWTQTPAGIQEHQEAVAAQSGAASSPPIIQIGAVGASKPYNALGRFARPSPKTNR